MTNKIGEEKISKSGQRMRIIKYVNYSDIDVQFEDGTIVTHKSYGNFKKGAIKNPNNHINPRTFTLKQNHEGETATNNYGLKMTIIKCNGYNDIDVKFEDGTIVTGKSYAKFKKGEIQNPNNYINPRVFTLKQKYEGETATNNSGQKMRIIKYNGCQDIDIEFEDGTIVTGKSYDSFKKGAIKNPNHNLYSNRLGEENISKSGQKMRIVKYNGYNDIDVEFEDGTFVTGKSYSCFLSGEIKNPNFHLTKLGEENVSTCGQKMSIIKYNGYNDIDVEFEDGTIVTGKSYGCFKKGTIGNPNYYNKINEEKIAFCGLKMVIVKYNTNNDIDVEFEDGEIIKHKKYCHFTDGNIAHPFLSTRHHSVYKGIATKFAWRENNKVYYTCKCQKCGEENIWTPQQMIEHAKKCSNTVH